LKKHQILSPIATGNGAYIVHKTLETEIPGYNVVGYNPSCTFFPFALRGFAPIKYPRLIHTTPDYAIFFHRKVIPTVLTFQNYVLDLWMRSYSSPLQRIHYATDLRLWSRMAVHRAHTITAVSNFTAGLAQNDLDIFHPLRVIYNGIDTALFTPAHSNTSRKELGVFFSGNLTRRKGAHWLHAIGKRLKKNVTIFYTQGLRTRKPLQASHGLKAIGPVPFRQMANRYREMDILLLPTVREGLSLSVLEAMACGLPVVASNCSSLPEQIDHGKGGFLCPVGDVDDFAEKINILAYSPRLRKEMGEYNRAKVEKKFTLERMVTEYRDLFEEVLG
jgi:L-malate glycosyltransferase